jgi:hypothetical protein
MYVVDYSIVAKYRTEITAIFREILENFCCTLKLLFIYLFHDFSRNS